MGLEQGGRWRGGRVAAACTARRQGCRPVQPAHPMHGKAGSSVCSRAGASRTAARCSEQPAEASAPPARPPARRPLLPTRTCLRALHPHKALVRRGRDVGGAQQHDQGNDGQEGQPEAPVRAAAAAVGAGRGGGALGGGAQHWRRLGGRQGLILAPGAGPPAQEPAHGRASGGQGAPRACSGGAPRPEHASRVASAAERGKKQRAEVQGRCCSGGREHAQRSPSPVQSGGGGCMSRLQFPPSGHLL